MKRVLHIIDSKNYVRTNCFQHQLAAVLPKVAHVETRELHEVLGHRFIGKYDLAVSCLKQRTLVKVAPGLQTALDKLPVVVYDQDPWEAFRDGSPYKGAYRSISTFLNVKSFAVTTQWWADYIAKQGLPSSFVRMWVLPEYCSREPAFDSRSVPVGFIGSIHSYRKQLFDTLEDLGTNVIVQGGGLNYAGYLEALSRLQCFIHSEDSPVVMGGVTTNLNVGLWIKDVEAASRGCFSIRNRGSGSETYLAGIKTVMLYDDPSEVPALLDRIQRMDPEERQSLIDETVEYIRTADRWLETANALVMNSDP